MITPAPPMILAVVSSEPTNTKRFISRCTHCEQQRDQHQFHPLRPLAIPEVPWRHLAMDFMGPFPAKRGEYDFLLVVIDRLTKYVFLEPCEKEISAKSAAFLFYRRIFPFTGVPTSLVMDRDPRFVAKFWTLFHDFLGTKIKLTAPYHAQTNGITERTNRVIKSALQKWSSEYPMASWHDHIGLLQFAINCSINRSTGFAPAHFLGVVPLSPLGTLGLFRPQAEPDSKVDKATVEDARKAATEIEMLISLAKHNLLESQFSMKQYADTSRPLHSHLRALGPDTWVYVHRKVLHEPQNKLQMPWIGPFRVLKVPNSHTREIEFGPQFPRAHSLVNIENLKPATLQLPQIRSDGKYELNKILKKRKKNNRWEYLVLWKHFPRSSATWEPQSLVENYPCLLQEFDARNKS